MDLASRIKGRGYVDHFLYVLCGKFLRSTQISINVTQKNQTKTNIFLTSRNVYKLLFSKAFNIKKTQIYIYKIILLNLCFIIAKFNILLCICIPFQKQPKKERKNV